MRVIVGENLLTKRGFPEVLGANLAVNLMLTQLDWNDLELDVTWLRPTDLISAFFNSFLQTIYEAYPDNDIKLNLAKKIKWITKFDFQQANIQSYVLNFKLSTY